MSRSPVLACPACRRGLEEHLDGYARCLGCDTTYPQHHGVLDLLGDPNGAVRAELRGLAAENGVDFDREGPDAVKFLTVPGIESTEQLMDRSRHDAVRYYQQTESAFLEALSRARVDAHMIAAEIGAERTMWKLRVIEDLCDELFAVNIFFHCPVDPAPPGRTRRVLADMNVLPFTSESIDLLVYSATLHHAEAVDRALAEAARVLRPGGRAIVVNEPVAGVAKRLGGPLDHDRDEAIHEDLVSYATWRRAIRASGLRADHFVPAWFLGQLAEPADLPVGTRFGRVAAPLARVARRPTVADVARAMLRVPGQALLGLPLNAVLWKERG